MNETNKPEVLQRLDRLERENRRWKVLGCTAFAVLGLIVLVGATGSKGTKVAEEIRARKFVLVDKAGKVRGKWTAPGLLDTRVRVFDLMRPPQLERVFPALPGPAFGSRSPRESNDGCTGS